MQGTDLRVTFQVMTPLLRTTACLHLVTDLPGAAKHGHFGGYGRRKQTLAALGSRAVHLPAAR